MRKNLFDKNWFVALVSLFFTMLLFLTVSNEKNVFLEMLSTNNSASVRTTLTISNVPVRLGEHDEGTYVSGVPETVSVELTGPRNIVNQISSNTFTVQTESLVGVEGGVRSIGFEVTGLPSSIEYKVTPDRFYGTISTKETIDKKVEYQLSNELVADGYTVQNVSLNVDTITLSGSSAEIAKVDRVVISITSDAPQTETFTNRYRVQILDVEGNPLDVNPSVAEIEATVEIQPESKEVSLVIVPVGERTGISYSYQFAGASTVQVSGPTASQYTQLNVSVDVSQLTESATVNGIIESIEGLTLSQTEVPIAVTMVTSGQNNDTTTTRVEETTSSETTEIVETTESE